MARLSFRPLPRQPLLKGWRLTGFADVDNYMQDAERRRYVLQTTYEHPYVNVGVDYLKTSDKASSALTDGVDLNPTLKGTGIAVWATPKKVYANGSSIEALVRYDHMKPGRHGERRDDDHVAGRPGRARDRRRGLLVPDAGQRVGRHCCSTWTARRTPNWTPGKPTARKFYVHTLISF